MDEFQEQNPYAAPQTIDGVIADAEMDFIAVQGKYLVIGSRPTLPRRCVVTNKPLPNKNPTARTLSYAPSFRMVLSHSYCYPSYCVSKPISRRSLVKAAIIAVATLLIAFWIHQQQGAGVREWLWIAAIGLGTGISSLQEQHLRVVYATNGYFWLSGCCDDFINQCQQEYGDYTGPLAPSKLTSLFQKPLF